MCKLRLAAAVAALSCIGVQAQAEVPASARASFDKAMVAARQQAWDIAIQNLQEARKAAPASPEILYNLGLAESKLPGRELRAIAWFGAYLSAEPKAENAAAVRDFIAELQVKNESDTQRLIRTVQAAAQQIPNENGGNFSALHRDEALADVAGLWASVGNPEAAAAVAALISPKDSAAKTHIADGQIARITSTAEGGDFPGALDAAAAIVDQVESAKARDAVAYAQYDYVNVQVAAGDVAGALRTADAIGPAIVRAHAEGKVAEAQARAGDIPAALSSEAAAAQAAEQASPDEQSSARISVTNARVAIITAQLAAFDIAGAERTAEPLVDSPVSDSKSEVEYAICQGQLEGGDIAGGRRTADLIMNAQLKFFALREIAEAQAAAADVSGAQATLLVLRKAADLPDNQRLKTEAEESIANAEKAIAEAQLKSGDAAGARATILLAAQAGELIAVGYQRNTWLSTLAGLRAEAGDVAAAQRTADSITDPDYRVGSEVAIAQAQAKADDLAGARASLMLAATAAEKISAASYRVIQEISVGNGQAKIGDVAAARASILLAQQTTRSLADPYDRAWAAAAIADAHAKTGDVTAARSAILAAQETAGLITDPARQFYIQTAIAKAQAQIGDLAGARASILIAQNTGEALTNGNSGYALADAQIKAGDLAGALTSADLIVDNAKARRLAFSDIAKAQGKAGAPAPPPAPSGRYPPRRPLVSVSDWTTELGALGKPLFLDPAAYLRALPSDTPQKAFTALLETAQTLVKAQGTVDVMLARQAR